MRPVCLREPTALVLTRGASSANGSQAYYLTNLRPGSQLGQIELPSAANNWTFVVRDSSRRPSGCGFLADAISLQPHQNQSLFECDWGWQIDFDMFNRAVINSWDNQATGA